MNPSPSTGADVERDHLDAILRRYAGQLGARRWRWAWWAGPGYHLLADALYWPDEAPLRCRGGECEDLLRLLWHYRTGLILSQPRPYADVWQRGKALFPHWVGFHPSRCRSLRRYRATYRAAHIASLRCIAELTRQDS